MLDLKPIVELSRSIRAHGLFGRVLCRAVGKPEYPGKGGGGGGQVMIQGFLKENWGQGRPSPLTTVSDGPVMHT